MARRCKDDLWLQIRWVEIAPRTENSSVEEVLDAPLQCGKLSEAITPYFDTAVACAWRRHYRSFRTGSTSGAHGETPLNSRPASSSRRVNAREQAAETVRLFVRSFFSFALITVNNVTLALQYWSRS